MKPMIKKRKDGVYCKDCKWVDIKCLDIKWPDTDYYCGGPSVPGDYIRGGKQLIHCVDLNQFGECRDFVSLESQARREDEG